MKQLPRISASLYGLPWGITIESHSELSATYKAYLTGNLPPLPAALDPAGEKSYGISHEADHASKMAIVYLSGVITKRAPEMMCGPPLVDLAKLDELLEEIAQDSALETIVFSFDSPGGIMIGLEETSRKIRALTEIHGKKTVAYTDFQMCSAAMFLAAACDEIYAAPSAIVGSIGVYCAGLDDSKAWEMEGLELILSKSGSLKAMGHPGKNWSQEERDHLQERTDKCGLEFRTWMTSRRPGIPAEAMQGQWFYGKEAPAALLDGLFDDLPELIGALLPAAP